MAIPFVPRIDDAPYAVATQVSPLVQRVIAQNPSKFSYHGTGTYILGSQDVVVIDPGPILDSHRDALVRALDGRNVVGIVVTHCHSDHSPLTEWLHKETGATRFAIGPHRVYKGFVEEDDHDPSEDDPDEKKPESDEEKETIDMAFTPDYAVVDGERFFATDQFSLTAVATPGHTSNHLCVSMDAENALFTGDHVMGWSTTVVSPPDGDMGAYMASLELLSARVWSRFLPGHGEPIEAPAERLAALTHHRKTTGGLGVFGVGVEFFARIGLVFQLTFGVTLTTRHPTTDRSRFRS